MEFSHSTFHDTSETAASILFNFKQSTAMTKNSPVTPATPKLSSRLATMNASYVFFGWVHVLAGKSECKWVCVTSLHSSLFPDHQHYTGIEQCTTIPLTTPIQNRRRKWESSSMHAQLVSLDESDPVELLKAASAIMVLCHIMPCQMASISEENISSPH